MRLTLVKLNKKNIQVYEIFQKLRRLINKKGNPQRKGKLMLSSVLSESQRKSQFHSSYKKYNREQY